MSPRVCAGAKSRNYARKRDANSQELANAGIIAHARCDNARSSVSLGYIMARADNLWACEDWAPPCAESAGAVVRVFFGGGVIGVFSVAALRALDTVASIGGPPGACASSKSADSSASTSSRSHSSGSCPASNWASQASPSLQIRQHGEILSLSLSLSL